MNIIKTFIVLICLSFFACSDHYEQRYDTFNDFNKANQRNKGCFPNLISSDAYDLKNDSYLDEDLCAFGTFSYSKTSYYDSIFTQNKEKSINFSIFKDQVKMHKDRIPKWFLETELDSKGHYESIQLERFYITRDVSRNKIYFILSN